MFVSLISDVAISQVRHPRTDIRRAQLIQTPLHLLQVSVLGIGRTDQDDVLLLGLGLQVLNDSVLAICWHDYPTQQ
jgi:hypothetical protein